MRVIQFEKHKNHKKKGKVRADKNFILQERKKGKHGRKTYEEAEKKRCKTEKQKKRWMKLKETKPRENGI